MTRRDWDMTRRRGPVRARGGQDVGYLGGSRPRQRVSLVALGIVLSSFDSVGLDNLERTMIRRRSVSAHEIKVSLGELFAAERRRRESRETILPSEVRLVAGLDAWKLYSDFWELPFPDLQKLADIPVPLALAETVSADVETIKRTAASVIRDRQSGAEPPLF